jgi:hypothetical protein
VCLSQQAVELGSQICGAVVGGKQDEGPGIHIPSAIRGPSGVNGGELHAFKRPRRTRSLSVNAAILPRPVVLHHGHIASGRGCRRSDNATPRLVGGPSVEFSSPLYSRPSQEGQISHRGHRGVVADEEPMASLLFAASNSRSPVSREIPNLDLMDEHR